MIVSSILRHDDVVQRMAPSASMYDAEGHCNQCEVAAELVQLQVGHELLALVDDGAYVDILADSRILSIRSIVICIMSSAE